MELAPVRVESAFHPSIREPESLFERFPRLYAFFRDRLFRDDSERIAIVLWPSGNPPAGTCLLELGCGPGFYACRLAGRFPQVRVVGIDRSERQVSLASSRAVARRLHNCRFEHADVRALPWRDGTVDAVVASRLFTIVAERERVIGEMHRVLRPGGRCFIAEPCSAIRTAMPLGALWMLAGVTSLFQGQPMSYCEPRRPVVLAANSFGRLVESQPWGRVWRWQDSQYHYAICEKGVTSIDVPPRLGNPFQPGITL